MPSISVRIVLLAWAAASLVACGGGSSGNPRATPDPAPVTRPGTTERDNSGKPPVNNTPTPAPSTSVDAAQRDLFAQTVYPLLKANCAICHGDTGDIATSPTRLASSNLTTAYSAVKAANGVTLSDPQGSILVTRLLPDNHFCWTDCAADAQAMADAISTWARLAKPEQTPLNANPVAVADNATTPPGAAVITGNVLANDTDPDNETLTVVSFDSRSANNASVQYNNDGTFTYRPASEFIGQDSFTYTISDPLGGTAIGSVTVTVVSSPLAIADSFSSYVDHGIITDSVLNNDFDPANTELSISAFDQRSARGGTVAAGPAPGQFTYSPAAGFSGRDRFSYTVINAGGASTTADVFIGVTPRIERDPDRFLTFLNRGAAQFQESDVTARAYYATVDPERARTNLADWRRVTGFASGGEADAEAIYVNNADLGFSRRMFVRSNSSTGQVASYVENYPTLNDAVNQTNLIATVAMEYTTEAGQTPAPNAHWLTTFYVFGPDGTRELGADLDGRGFKFVPGLCNICHGGEPQPLLADGSYPKGGDTGAGFLSWDLDTYLYSNTPSLSRAAQESQFKIFNSTVLKTRPTAAQRELIEGWYGGAGLPNAEFDGTFIPTGWRSPQAATGVSDLYLNVVAPSCRACHVMRGRTEQSDLDFATYAKFLSFSERTQQLVFDQGTMPLALRTYERFWNDQAAVDLLAQHLPNFTRGLSDGSLLVPGRPLAEAGPSYETSLGQVNLAGSGSVFTGGPQAFVWELISHPINSNAAVNQPNRARTTFLADVPGNYIVHLTVNDGIKGTPSSAPAELLITATEALQPVSFSRDVAPLFVPCARCHNGPGLMDLATPNTLYDNIIPFIDQDIPWKSKIVTKPSGSHHAGGTISGFETTRGPNYMTLLRWIGAGAAND